MIQNDRMYVDDGMQVNMNQCLFVFLALQPIVVVFSQPGSGL